MALGQNFPVKERYQGHVLDAYTIARGGGWWTAVLLIEDPESEQPFVCVYRWQKSGKEWKERKSIKLQKLKHIQILIDGLKDFATRLKDEPAG